MKTVEDAIREVLAEAVKQWQDTLERRPEHAGAVGCGVVNIPNSAIAVGTLLCDANGQWEKRWNGKEWEPYEKSEPTTPEWRGPQDGLPPVDTECEAFLTRVSRWERGKILAIYDGMAVVAFGDRMELQWTDQLRPLRSDRDRAIDEAEGIASPTYDEPFDRTTYRAILGVLYDFGALKAPEGAE